jgi:hypothetical protein
MANEPALIAPTAPTVCDMQMNDEGNCQVSSHIYAAVPWPLTMTDPRKPVRHYGLLKFLRRATLTSGGGGGSSSSINYNYYAASLRTPGIPHAFLRSGHGLGRSRRTPDFMRGVSRADLHTPRGVRRSSLCARGLLGGVQCARARAGASGLAR